MGVPSLGGTAHDEAPHLFYSYSVIGYWIEIKNQLNGKKHWLVLNSR